MLRLTDMDENTNYAVDINLDHIMYAIVKEDTVTIKITNNKVFMVNREEYEAELLIALTRR